MKRTTAQKFLNASGILALLGGGSCFLGFKDPFQAIDAGTLALSGLGALVIAAILGIIGLVGLKQSKG
jgi:hypothetical protein